MTAEADFSPEAVVRRFYDALNARDFNRAAGAVAERCEWESVAAETTHRGPDPVVAGLRAWADAFPDGRVDVLNTVAAGPFVVVEWRTRGTQTGPYRGAAATGNHVVRRGCAVAEVEGGKIVRFRDYYDRRTLDEQLGR